MSTRAHPFRIQVRDIVHRPGEMRQVHTSIPLPETWGEGLLTVRAGSELDEDLRLESVHEGILVSGTAEATAVGVCGRCLRDIEQSVEVEIQELFAYRKDESFEYEVHDDHVDLEPVLRDAVVLSLPFQPICSEDCPGLDPETGERLTSQPASDSRQAIDPRWAALTGFTTDISTDDSGAGDREER
ncbi:YceD family protein [Mycetocola reblochoni]|uniref:COG1399 protein, clustered with ribosomal protein L32p n=2 Tax=Mycetocola reblochoni TaxID=331618 RepID=A0A1R4JC75_9MICO|nr:DUF177 domain-containing protein [Mycetocola reblochoni]RLP70011.1 DUF177 domain-containing protein [Mycetocola reblochoni]SJN29313.1 COG1399 protein, clustered with ribosomal protein L32p [Mycetocola reblochoni REB411]